MEVGRRKRRREEIGSTFALTILTVSLECERAATLAQSMQQKRMQRYVRVRPSIAPANKL